MGVALTNALHAVARHFSDRAHRHKSPALSRARHYEARQHGARQSPLHSSYWAVYVPLKLALIATGDAPFTLPPNVIEPQAAPAEEGVPGTRVRLMVPEVRSPAPDELWTVLDAAAKPLNTRLFALTVTSLKVAAKVLPSLSDPLTCAT
jgi:hypothetical protein